MRHHHLNNFSWLVISSLVLVGTLFLYKRRSSSPGSTGYPDTVSADFELGGETQIPGHYLKC